MNEDDWINQQLGGAPKTAEAKPASRSIWRRFIDNFTLGAVDSPWGAEGVVRATSDLSAEELNKRERVVRDRLIKRGEEDPAWGGRNYPINQTEIVKGITDTVGGILGSVDPTWVLNPGKGIVQKAVAQGGINAATDLSGQAVQVKRGVRDEINPVQTIINAASGAGLSAGSDVARKVRIERMGLKLAKDVGGDFGTVTSTIRSPARNKKVGGAKNSYHLSGRAIDIARGKGVSHADIEAAYRKAGFNIVESLDEGDHSHFAFDFGKSAPAPKDDGPSPEEAALYEAALIDAQDPPATFRDQNGILMEDVLRQSDDGSFETKTFSQEDNVVPFPGEKRPPLTEDELNDITTPRGNDDFADVLTPAERQDMDASVPAPPAVRGALSEDIIDSIRGQGRAATTPVNDMVSPEELRAGEAYAAGSGTTGGPGGPTEVPPMLTRLTQALEEAGSLKGEQADMYQAQRAAQALKMEKAAKSVRGRARLYAMRGAQKGELDKPGFDPIEGKFSQEEIDTMSDYISEFTGWTSVHDSANALDGWNKLLKGTIPTNSELALLEKVLPRDAITAILKKMPKDTAEMVADALNIPRSILSSFDISAPGRQGVFLVGRKEWRQGLGDMIRQFGSEEAHQRIQQAIREDPDFALAERAGLATQDTQVRLGGKEENFASNLAEKYIPGIRASDRSFSGYLHKLRFDVFKSIVENHRELGVDVNDPKYLKSLGSYLNNATGRGDLPKMLEKWAPFLNATLFSPRLMASRINLLLNPVFWAKMHPNVRKEALKDMARFQTVAVGVLGLAAMNGADISLDPTSTDFLKIKFGDRRYDILGGFQQYMVLVARMSKYLAGEAGVIDKEKGLKQTNLQNAPLRFARTKLAPIPSAIVDSWLGKDVTGQDTNVAKEAFGLVTPMSAGDIAEAAYDDGLVEGALAVPSLGGVGYAKYPPKKPKDEKLPEDAWIKKQLEGTTGSSSEDKWLKEQGL